MLNDYLSMLTVFIAQWKSWKKSLGIWTCVLLSCILTMVESEGSLQTDLFKHNKGMELLSLPGCFQWKQIEISPDAAVENLIECRSRK